MSGPPAGWLERWSLRKRAAAKAGAPGGPAPGKDVAQATAVAGRGTEDPAAPATAATTNGVPAASPSPLPPPLPAIEELTAQSDFTPFLHPDVPLEAHQQALRRLWSSDPVYGFRDGLTDYDEDYTAIGIVERVIETAYRAGSGYAADEAPPAEVAEGPADCVDDTAAAATAGAHAGDGDAAAEAPAVVAEDGNETADKPAADVTGERKFQ